MDGRKVRRWWATAARAPQYVVQIVAIPAPDGWIVRLLPLTGICEGYETVVRDGWEAAEEVREIMASLDVSSEWTASVDR